MNDHGKPQDDPVQPDERARELTEQLNLLEAVDRRITPEHVASQFRELLKSAEPSAPGTARSAGSSRPATSMRRRRVSRFLLTLAGADPKIVDRTPDERLKLESLGWAILITSGIAAVSMWFGLSSVLGISGIVAVPTALLWGLMVMGIDRWLITSMPASGSRKFAMAVPRLALALLLGTLISTPLVLRIFQPEINAQIATMQQQSYSMFLRQQQASGGAKQVSTYLSELERLNNIVATHGAATTDIASDPELVAYNKQLTNLNNEVAYWTSLKNHYYKDYICQLYGGPACPEKGYGAAAKESLKNYESASQEVDTLKAHINQLQQRIVQRDDQLASNSPAEQQARYKQAIAQQPSVKKKYETALQRQNELQAGFFASNQAAAHGILIKLEALSQLSNGDFTVAAARFLLFLLFLVIECLPVTVKLLQRPGLDESALKHAREAERRDETAVRRPVPGHRPDAIWTSARARPGSVVSEDDQLAEAMDDFELPREHDTADRALTDLANNQAVDKLPSIYSDVMRLVADGFTQSEIAERLGIPLGTVKSRLARAAAAMRVESGDPLSSDGLDGSAEHQHQAR